MIKEKSKILLLDFDGVIHSYFSGWQGARNILDPPLDGSIEFLLEAQKYFHVCIYSNRSRYWGGRRAMKKWLKKQFFAYAYSIKNIKDLPAFSPSMEPWEYECDLWATQCVNKIYWPTKKPEAFITIDDKCICFQGKFPDPQKLLNFKPWNFEAQEMAKKEIDR